MNLQILTVHVHLSKTRHCVVCMATVHQRAIGCIFYVCIYRVKVCLCLCVRTSEPWFAKAAETGFNRLLIRSVKGSRCRNLNWKASIKVSQAWPSKGHILSTPKRIEQCKQSVHNKCILIQTETVLQSIAELLRSWTCLDEFWSSLARWLAHKHTHRIHASVRVFFSPLLVTKLLEEPSFLWHLHVEYQEVDLFPPQL